MATKLPTEPISGQLYPDLKGKPGKRVFQNPPFHPNILNVGGDNKAIKPPSTRAQRTQNSSSFQRGAIVGGAGAVDGWKDQITYIVNFLYNPSTIQETRSLDTNSGVLPGWARNPNDPGQYNTQLNSVVNFSLLFDRTYEMWDSNYVDTIQGVFGVRADVEAFYNLMGVNFPVAQSKSGLVGRTDLPGLPNGVADVIVQGPMMQIPANLTFGVDTPATLNYFGYISSFDVTYTHFTQRMVPVRCAINVGFTLMPAVTSVTDNLWDSFTNGSTASSNTNSGQ
jgi:hypothetical protein